MRGQTGWGRRILDSSLRSESQVGVVGMALGRGPGDHLDAAQGAPSTGGSSFDGVQEERGPFDSSALREGQDDWEGRGGLEWSEGVGETAEPFFPLVGQVDFLLAVLVAAGIGALVLGAVPIDGGWDPILDRGGDDADVALGFG